MNSRYGRSEGFECIINFIYFQKVTEESNMFKNRLRIKSRTHLFERKLSELLSSDDLKVNKF